METQSFRHDYFLIWGHGLQYKQEILNHIRENGSFEILKIISYDIKDMKKFIKKVYSHDYAPYKHLKGKTRYLLSTESKVIFVFVKNYNINEDFFGDGKFRHIESKTLKATKEEIRNKFNEKINGIRTENHVIHGSDNENQTDHILKIIGHKEGINIFKQSSKIIPVPYHLRTSEKIIIKKIKTKDLYCIILSKDKSKPWITKTIEDSPHYKYIKGKKEEYIKYLEDFGGVNLQDDYSLEKFDTLISNFFYLGEGYETNYIIVRTEKKDKFIIRDGLHRAAILKNKNVGEIIVAITP